MRNFLHKWRTMMSATEGDIKERVFLRLMAVGIVLSLLAFLESVLISDSIIMMISLGSLLIAVVLSIVLTVQFHKLDIATTMLALVLCLDVFPGIFFTNGGIEGGATVWLVSGYFICFLLFSGRRLYILVAVNTCAIILFYVLSYFYPNLVISLPGRKDVYLDSAFSVVSVGIALSLMLKYYMKTYKEQRDMVEWQKSELERNNQSQTHFFASMSHELRTPINTIIGLNDYVLREAEDEVTIENSKKIQNASRMLLSLINDILDLSQLETRKMTIAENEYRPEEMFSELMDMVGILTEEKKLEFVVDIDDAIPRVLWGDRKRIQQILLNLLSNAVKYTPAGTVTFRAEAERTDEDTTLLKLSIKDTGVGIRKENIKTIFDIFKRVDGKENAKIEGSGLGLSITKQLVDLMGGEITVDSIYTKGSTFTVTISQKVIDPLPMGDLVVYRERTAKQKERYYQSFEAPKGRVLIVDDSETNGFIMQKLLEHTRLEVDTVTSGQACLELTQNKMYHVILLDHMMPGMDGIETLKLLQKQTNGLCKNTPVFALTANAVSNAEQYYQEQGFDGYLEKPIDGVKLEKVLLQYLPDDIVEFRRDELGAAEDNHFKVTKQKKKKKVIVTTDCVAEITPQILEEYEMGLMYLYIQTEKGRFADTVEIDSDNLLDYITEDEVKAKAVSVEVDDYERFYAEQLLKAEEVVHISMAKHCGKSYEMAVSAAESFGHVHVVDSGHIAAGQRILALYAAKLAMEGASADYIIEQVNWISKKVISKFYMPNTKQFYRSGYIGRPIMVLCDVFHLHPVLRMKKSRLCVTGFCIGDVQKARVRFAKRMVFMPKRIEDKVLFISHVGLNTKEMKEIKSEILKAIPNCDFYIQKAALSTACNSGHGSLAISYCRLRKGQGFASIDE